MANVRIIHDNAAERATITASSSSVANSAAGLNTNKKSRAHRSTGTSVTYTLTWPAAETVRGVILPATNLSGTSTIRVYGTNFDSGIKFACPNTTLDTFKGGIKNVNNFPYGGLSKTAVWLNSAVTTTVLNVEIIDSAKASLGYPTYIDCSRIICGNYWEPTIGASKSNLNISMVDTTQTSRNDSGDLISDRGTIHDQLSFNLDILTKTDKEQLIGIIKNVGSYKSIAVSVFPGTNSRDEQDYIIYGNLELSSIGYLVHNYYSNTFSIIGW